MANVLHKLLRGERAGLYLPFALHRLRALEAIHGDDGVFQQKYVVDGHRIEVEQAPPFQYIRIVEEGGISYEFFTSEHVSDVTLASPDHAHGVQFSYVCGSATRARFSKVTGKLSSDIPCYSSSLVSPTNRWPVLDCESPQTKSTNLITWRSWQNQKFFEHCWHPNNDGKSLVTSTQAQPPGWANQAGLYSPYCFARFGNVTSFASDITLDVAPTLYTKGGLLSGAPQLEHGWLYWRHAAVHSKSGRSFFISTDNYGRFQVYPVKDYGAGYAALAAGSQYRTYTPPYPAWVSVPNPSDFTLQFGQWLWRFNKDATKCVSIPFHSEATGWLKYLDNDSFFCAILPETSADIVPPIALTTAHEDTPGLVEFGIEIELTGSGDMDFNVIFTLLRNSYFGDGGRFFFDAAYALPDVEGVGVAEDTLLTAEVECKTPAGYYLPGPMTGTSLTDVETIDACRQLQSEIVINANNDVMAPTEKFRFTALSREWLQFPTIDGSRTLAGAEQHPGFAAINQDIPTTTGTRTYTPAGPIVYDPDSVLDPATGFHTYRYGRTRGFLYALELSTLSLLYEVDDEVAGTFSLHAVSYGNEFYRYDGTLGYSLPPFTAAAATDAVPSARVYQAMFNNTINIDFGEGFNVHPHGHWALGLGGIRNAALPLESDLDWISVFKGKDKDGNILRARYKHKDLFNGAFGTNRDYSFYHVPFPEESLGDYGSFRTAGFWVTFR